MFSFLAFIGAKSFIVLPHGGRPIHVGVKARARCRRRRRCAASALMRDFGKHGRQIAPSKPGCCAIDVVFAHDFKAERARLAVVRAPQHDRMVVGSSTPRG